MKFPESVHIDQVLSNFSVNYYNQQRHYVAPRISPVLYVDKQSDKYYKGDKSMFTLENKFERAPGAEYPQVTWSWSTDEYVCKSYGLSVALPAETLANADAQLRLGQKASRILVDKLALAYEKRVADICTSATYMTNTNAVGANDKWDDDTPDIPILKQVDTAIEAVAGRIFQPANMMLIGRQVWNALRRNASILDLLYGDGPQGIPTPAQVASLMGLDEIVVANVKYATSAGVVTDLYGKVALVYYMPPNVSESLDQEVCPMRTFIWNVDGNGRFQVSGPEFVRSHKGYKWYIDDYSGEKVVCADAAQLLTAVIA